MFADRGVNQFSPHSVSPRSRSRRFCNRSRFCGPSLECVRSKLVIIVGRQGSQAIAQSLTDMDLVFIEEAFERLLLDYDRVFSAMAIPACLWRRTGEIYKGNREFAELVGLDSFMLRDVSPMITLELHVDEI